LGDGSGLSASESRDRFGENPIVRLSLPWAKPAATYEVYFMAEQIAQTGFQVDKFDEADRGGGIEIYQNVYVRSRRVFAACNRAKDRRMENSGSL
jgi:hypothetical protein